MSKKKHNELLKHHTTLQLGGPAALFVSVTTKTELKEALCEAAKAQLPVTILGGGSNILASDEGVSGMVIKMAIMGRTYEPEGTTVRCTFGAGEMLDRVVSDTVERGWWGLENLSAIPGTVGATPIQNVGAYGVEIADVFVSLVAVHLETGEERVFTFEECGFSYRDSFFKSAAGRLWCVVALTLRVSATFAPRLAYKDLAAHFHTVPPTTPSDVRNVVMKIRSEKFPDWRVVGTAGSFFKNPILSREQYATLTVTYPQLPGFPLDGDRVKIPLGYILDKVLKLRGVYKGNVGCFVGQALVVVTKEAATAGEVEAFAAAVAQSVQEKTAITIEWEVTKVGF